MKSFSQFLQESCLSEAEVTQSGGTPTGQARVTQSSVTSGGRVRTPSEQAAWEAANERDLKAAQRRAQRKPSGAAARPDLQFGSQRPQTSKGGALVPQGGNTPSPSSAPLTPRPQGTTTTVSGSAITGKKPPSPLTPPQVKPVDVKDITNPRRSAAELKVKQAAAGVGPSGKPFIGQPGKSSEIKAPKGGKILKWGGRALGVLNVASDAADEYGRQRRLGRSTASSLGMGLTKAAGGTAGWEAGSATGAALGGTIGSLAPGPGTLIGAGIGGLVGGALGSEVGSKLAGKASQVVAGAAPKEKAAMTQANRQRQAGSAVTGIGGKTTFSQKKPGGPAFMSTGVGSQRKTVQLAKTSEIQRDGKSTTGHLAFKGGKAVYKAGPSAQTLAQTSSNPLERIGRTMFAGAYKQHDIQKQQQALQKARESDIARGRALGLKYGPGR